jgi:hypothetical protein
LPDEFGLRVGRSLEPNARIVPFHFAFNRLAYSLLVLTEDIAGGGTFLNVSFFGNKIVKIFEFFKNN